MVVKTIMIDEYLIINVSTGARRWLTRPVKLKVNEVCIRVKGRVKYPEMNFTADFGEITIAEADVMAQASAG